MYSLDIASAVDWVTAVEHLMNRMLELFMIDSFRSLQTLSLSLSLQTVSFQVDCITIIDE